MSRLTAARIVCYTLAFLTTPFVVFGLSMVFGSIPHDQKEGAGIVVASLTVAILMFMMAHKWLPHTHWFKQITPRDLCCPKCGYNMRGLTQRKCPECGSEFTIDHLNAK